MANQHCFVIVCIEITMYKHTTTIVDVYTDEARALYTTKVLNERDKGKYKDYRVFKSLLHTGP